jgi:AraC family transcriptional activator of pobA
MKNTPLLHLKNIEDYHQLFRIAKPEHPLISVINLATLQYYPFTEATRLVYDFYCIALKRAPDVTFRYGQYEGNAGNGLMFFMSPGQVISMDINPGATEAPAGWILFIHPDFLWNTSLATNIKRYEFFGYSVKESLCLSPKEEKKTISIIKNIQQEYQANIDHFSQNIIIAQLELLLTYSERFYQRQFITRKIEHHQVLSRLEDLLNRYFNSDDLTEKGLPTVQYISDHLHISPDYLRSLLKTVTGMNTQQHIHEKLIEKAKEKLSTTTLSVSEIAYELGFEHPQSFNKLFKTKTHVSPLAFRQSFN